MKIKGLVVNDTVLLIDLLLLLLYIF